jgi:iron complex transport system ATP-binding protein
MSEAQALHVESLSVARGRRRILAGLSLPPLRAGEVTAVVGPNGSGKSTLLKAIAQLVPSTGRVALGQADLRQLAARQRARLIGYMPQAMPPGSELTALECVLVALQPGAGAGPREEMAAAILEMLGLTRLALTSLDRMSGGERQMVNLAQSIACSPRALLLDEPTSALDLARQTDVMQFLRRRARQETAVVVVLHDLSLAARWADRMVVLDEGRLWGAGAPEDVLTAAMLADVYGVRASVERVRDQLVVIAEPSLTHITDNRSLP